MTESAYPTEVDLGNGHRVKILIRGDEKHPFVLVHLHLKANGEKCESHIPLMLNSDNRTRGWFVKSYGPLTVVGTQAHADDILTCPRCGLRGRIVDGRWEDA